ncbi:P-loop containing nucleoside triphosphate hydrolase protein [Hyaloraphidium curvatum]|nr:P-loop containing nucleoside triphosphate hydrolase protein [Hyaloraphidium curvatum]
MASFYNLKAITAVPTADAFVDITLSKLQRKTPTVIHPSYQITRIRHFYMRKVKFAQDAFEERLDQILKEFPKLDEIHPFYADLLNVLYDRDHYKLALAQLSTAKHLIQNVGKDYARLLKFGDSLYRCKQLKRAALGRMCTVMKRQKDSLAYLEQVRQHMARLPSIDPNTRTLLICGYPNVGKSSFMNKVTRAQVDVQPYAFTTKSLFVGHMDYRYLRWQVIDTPGILDHPLEERNTIEMQSITALAHLRACILYFVDASEQCGYTVAQQLALYKSIRPLFANKPTMLVFSKIDARDPSTLPAEQLAEIDRLVAEDKLEVLKMSSYTDEGVMESRNQACDRLLAVRVEQKLKGSKVADRMNMLHLALPKPRDDRERPAFVPEAVAGRVKYDREDPNRKKLERDIEVEAGGAGVYNVDLKKNYLLADDEWKHDSIPEIMDGHNVADFFDPDIVERLDALEAEEERLEAAGFYDEADYELDSDEERVLAQASEIRSKKELKRIEANLRKVRNGPTVSRIARPLARKAQVGKELAEIGVEVRGRSRSVVRGARDRSEGAVAMEGVETARSASRARSRSAAAREPSAAGLRDEGMVRKAEKMKAKSQTKRSLHGRKGESDRHIAVKLPKHLFAGKRGMGKTERR